MINRTTVVVSLIGFWYMVFIPMTNSISFLAYISRFIPIGMLLAWAILQLLQEARYNISRHSIIFLVVFVFALIYKLVIARDPDGFLEYLMFFGGIYGILTLAKQVPISSYHLNLLTTLIMIPSLFVQEKFTSISHHRFSLFPFLDGNWRVQLLSIHFTGVLGVFLLVANLASFRENRNHWHLIGMIFGGYITLFSGSRTSLIVFIGVLLLWFVSSKLLHYPILAVAIPCCIAIMPFLISDFVNQIVFLGFWGDLLKLNVHHYDVTAGRQWLWIYHWNLFVDYFWIGAGSSAVDFTIGSVVQGQVARAASESFFTRSLARDGIWGSIFVLFFVYCIWYSAKRSNFHAYVYSVIMMGLTVTLSTFGSTYNILAFLGYWLFFSSFKYIGFDPIRYTPTRLYPRVSTRREINV